MSPRFVFLLWIVPLTLLPVSAECGEKSPRIDYHGDPLPLEATARLGTIRLRHEVRISALAFSPDGKILASGGYSYRGWASRIRLWDAGTGKLLHDFGEETARGAAQLLFSPDGKTLASVGDYHALFYNGSHPGGEHIPYTKIHLWDVAAGKHRLTLTGHDSYVTSAAFSPDGKILVSVGADDTIRFWDPKTGKSIRVIKKKEVESFFQVFLTPDGKTLVTSSGDSKIRLWDAAAAKQTRAIRAPGQQITLHLSRDGKIAASAGFDGYDKIRLWDLVSGDQLGDCPNPGISGSWWFGPDRETLLLSVFDERLHHNELYLWNWKRKERVREFEGKAIHVQAAVFSPDGKTLAVAEPEAVRLWNTATGKELFPLAGHRAAIHSASVSPDGRTAATCSDDRTVRLWELRSGKPLQLWQGRQGQVFSVAFSPDGKLLASGGRIVRLWETQSAKNIATFTESESDLFHRLAFSPDGKILAGASGSGRVYRWDVRTGKKLATLDAQAKTGVGVGSLFLGVKQLACISKDGCNLYDLNSGNLVPRFTATEIPILEGGLYASAFSADGSYLVTANRSGEIYLREIHTGHIVNSVYFSTPAPKNKRAPVQPEERRNPIHSLAFYPYSRLVAAGYENGKIAFLDLLREKMLHTFHGHKGLVSTLTFTPDGKYLVSGSGDGTALVWQVPDIVRRPQREGNALTDAELGALDFDLSGGDDRKAFRAIEALIDAPAETVPLLRRRLRPIAPMDAKQASRWIGDLDSDRFAVREAARRELAKRGDRVETLLRSALAGKPTLEMRRQIEELLRPIKSEALYASRALPVLERIGTAEARQLLQDLSQGDAAAWRTRAARAALERMARRQSEDGGGK